MNQCMQYPNFQYTPNVYATHFGFDSKHRIKSIHATSVNGNVSYEFKTDSLVLAAGTLASSKIFLDSIYRNTGEIIRLHGLMDNRQILVPFVNLRMIGRKHCSETYQYHQLAMGIVGDNGNDYIHGQITTLKTALIHPIIQSIPHDLRTSISIFRNIRSALGVININFHDTRRDDNYLTLGIEGDSPNSVLIVQYSPPPLEKERIDQALRRVKRALLKLGCLVPPRKIHIRPMGASVHYAGTLPMSASQRPYTVSPYCQSHDFDNLHIVDGTSFPFLPAKNLTFTLMGNATRVADNAF